MSEIKVNKISPRSGTTLTLGDSGDDFIIPAGATLTNNGTASGFASIAWQSSIVTGTTLSAVAGNGYWIDTTSNACTITLPASASVGDQIIFSDYKRTWGTNAITINQNSLNFQGYSSPNPVYNTSGQSVSIVYSGATQGWIPTSDDDVTDEVPQPYSIDFLVVAGGGAGGGRYFTGGGGAGGYRTSTQSVNIGTTITVTVGDGGAGNNTGDGADGSNSSISGSGLTTITSAGGGGGAFGETSPSWTGSNGGSGGGGSGYDTSNGGTGNTPSTAPSQGNNGGGGSSPPNYNGGGGGGAGAVGVNGGATGGDGGAGTASSITGSSITRAGGGGGGAASPYAVGSGGAGGGGAGSQNGGTGTSGTANTGGGGGGTGNNVPSAGTGGSGGKGVVILSMPDADYSTTITGSPTVATGVSGKTVLTFTGDGSYTA